MHTVNLSSLKSNPASALRLAQRAPVMVMNRDQPHALMTSLADSGALDSSATRRALAAALVRDGGVSLIQAVRLADCDASAFLRYLALHNIPVINHSAREVVADLKTLDGWGAAKSA